MTDVEKYLRIGQEKGIQLALESALKRMRSVDFIVYDFPDDYIFELEQSLNASKKRLEILEKS